MYNIDVILIGCAIVSQVGLIDRSRSPSTPTLIKYWVKIMNSGQYNLPRIAYSSMVNNSEENWSTKIEPISLETGYEFVCRNPNIKT